MTDDLNGPVTEATARALLDATEANGRRLDDYETRDRRRRTQVVVLAISVLFDILLSVALGIVAYGASEASHKATKATSSAKQAEQRNLAACEAGNKTNKDQLDLWQFVFTFPAPADETADQRALREKQSTEFKAYINRVFAPKACKRP